MRALISSTLLAALLCSSCAIADVSLQITSLLERQALANGVDISQFGDLNVADVAQTGEAHYAILIQQGILNKLVLTQSGLSNQAAVKQYGNGNEANIIQRGEHNAIQLEQWGNRFLTIEQSGTGADISIIQY